MKPIGGTSGMVRLINRDLVMNALRAAPDGLSVSDLARNTGLSVATCANLAKTLAQAGEAAELPAESQGGRPAKRYAYNPDHNLVALIILRAAGKRTMIRHAVRNGDNRTVAEGREFAANFSVGDLTRILARLIEQRPAVRAAAISVPGIVSGGDIETADIPALAGQNLERRLREDLNIRVVTENDMTFAVAGYYNKNAASIGSGLAYAIFPNDVCPGMGLVVNGRLLKGKSDFAGEIANIPWPKAATKGKRRERDDLVHRMAAIVVAVASVVNPDVFVITGDLADPSLHDEVRNRCLERIPERHLPRLVFQAGLQADFEADSFDGMTALALKSLAGDIKLVETERLWCE